MSEICAIVGRKSEVIQSHAFSHIFTWFRTFSRCEKVWKSVRWITSKRQKKRGEKIHIPSEA